MRLNGLDLNLLVALDALLTERNVTRAAERVFLSQPAMSNALARLRECLGDELVVRSGRHTLLTPRAEALIEPVRQVLAQIESAIVTPPAFDPATSDRSFTLVASDYATTVFVQPLIQQVAAVAPRVRFKLLSISGSRPAERLECGDADLLVVPHEILSADHPSQRLFRDDYVCVTWTGSARFRDRLSLDDYQAAGHVVAQFGDERALAAESRLLEQRGVKRREEVIVQTLMAPAELVVGTDRVATVQRRLAVRAARHLPLRLWTVPVEGLELVEHVQWNRARDRDPGLRWLLAACEEAARSM